MVLGNDLSFISYIIQYKRGITPCCVIPLFHLEYVQIYTMKL